MKRFPYPPGPSDAWPPGLEAAVLKIGSIYTTATEYLNLESYDTHRLQFYTDRVVREAYPLLLAIEEAIPSHEAELLEWLATVSRLIAELLNILTEENEEGDNEPESSWIPHPVTKQSTGHPGQPKKMVDVDVMREALERQIPIQTLAATLGIDRKTLKKRMRDHGLEKSNYTTISDDSLDLVIQDFLVNHPRAGRRYVIGHLRGQHSIQVPEKRVRESLDRLNHIRNELRKQHTAVKSHVQYQVKRPHALWHMDGHHKLIKWGIVIHGMVDGYSRKARLEVTGLRANTSNSSKTVLLVFLDAIKENGVPSKVRGDRGGENRDVSILMILLRGPGRSSFMWGKSTYNTRIERMWGNLGDFFVRDWRAFFLRLERRHLLDHRNKAHLWLLHLLFLDEINKDCQEFKKTWNNHSLSGQGRNMSPNNIEYQGMLSRGIYHDVDSRPEFNIDELHTYYDQVLDNDSDSSDSGDGENEEYRYEIDASEEEHEDDQSEEEHDDDESEEEHEDDESEEEHEDDESEEEHEDESEEEHEGSEESESRGAEEYEEESDGSPMDTEESDDHDSVKSQVPLSLDYDLTEEARITTDSNILNQPVRTPRSACPFNAAELEEFERKLNNRNARGKLPRGYGIHSSELGSTGYDPFETIPLGGRGKTVTLELMNEKWRPRAEQWCQALHVFNRSLHAAGPST